jgi:hypothetical protein
MRSALLRPAIRQYRVNGSRLRVDERFLVRNDRIDGRDQ